VHQGKHAAHYPPYLRFNVVHSVTLNVLLNALYPYVISGLDLETTLCFKNVKYMMVFGTGTSRMVIFPGLRNGGHSAL